MTISEYMKKNRLKNPEELRLHLLNNLLSGKLPVAIASCPLCGEIKNKQEKK